MKHLRHFNQSIEELGGQALKRVEALDLPLAKWTGPIIQISNYIGLMFAITTTQILNFYISRNGKWMKIFVIHDHKYDDSDAHIAWTMYIAQEEDAFTDRKLLLMRLIQNKKQCFGNNN